MKILKNKLLFIFCFIFLMIPNVKAETEYYDDEGNPFRLVFDDTSLKTFVKNDFAIVYDDLVDGKTAAKFTKTNNGNELVSAYDYREELYITIYETTETYQLNNNIKYVVNVHPSATAGTNEYGRHWYWKRLMKDTNKQFTYKGQVATTSTKGLNQLNFSKLGSGGSIYVGNGWTQEAYGGLLLAVDKQGNVERIINLFENYNSLMIDLRDNAINNIFYSSTDVYDSNAYKVIIKKEEFLPKRDIPNAYYSLGCEENNPFIYNIYFNIENLEINDNVKIYKEDKLLKDIKYVYDPEETEIIMIENAESGYYKIDVVDENNELLYSATFHINVEIGDIFDENDTPVSLLDKIKMYLKGFKNNIKMFYEGFENFFSSLNFELRTGIFIITTIFIIVYIIKIII
ncbi:MAG: hypothetical protein II309_01050 [Bacilli bacterium]|nr:hypothetical protein [Bacilli bacterium]